MMKKQFFAFIGWFVLAVIFGCAYQYVVDHQLHSIIRVPLFGVSIYTVYKIFSAWRRFRERQEELLKQAEREMRPYRNERSSSSSPV